MLPFNKNLKPYARELRKNMTEAAQLLWSKIRRKQIKDYQFYRQKNIGNYIVDFYCPAAKVIIELDGGQHSFPEAQEKDRQRDAYLTSLGFTVLRFSNQEIFANMNGVLQRICEYL